MDLSLQTYTVRKAAKANLAQALRRIKDAGFSRVELARIPFDAKTAEIVRASGLSVTSLQVKPKILEQRFSEILSFCQRVECPIVVASVLPLSAIIGPKKCLLFFADRLNRMAKSYGEEGITLAFHPHDFEFLPLGDRLKWDILRENTDSSVKFVVDTYWVKSTGRNPRDWIAHLGTRVIGLHLRDCRPPKAGRKPKDAELGAGTIDFSTLLDSLPDHIRFGAVEQNSHDPWKSLAQSMSYLRALKIKKIQF